MENENIYIYIKKNFKYIFIKFFVFLFFFGTFYLFVSYLKIAFSVIEKIKSSIEIDANITKNLLCDSFYEDEEVEDEDKKLCDASFRNIILKKSDYGIEKIKEFCSRICIRNDLYVFLKKMNSDYELSFFSVEDDLFLAKKKKRLEREISNYFKKLK